MVKFNNISGVFIKLLGISIVLQLNVSFANEQVAKAIPILYPASQSQLDERISYPKQLLELAFSKISASYILVPGRISTTQSRALKLLNKDGELDIVWTMTSIEREQDFLPIRIPIYKGLIGWRIFIIVPQNQVKFNKITHLNQLSKLIAGQGLDWPDTGILRSNGLAVESSTSYEGLFEMLQKQRFEYFPRSVIEIWQELTLRPNHHFTVENSLLLRYPTAMYYFVKKDNSELASNIEKGLTLAIADGSFDTLFDTFNQKLIEQAKLKERKMINLSNPNLKVLTPLNNAQLWFNIQDIK
jgi:hypothetical protein